MDEIKLAAVFGLGTLFLIVALIAGIACLESYSCHSTAAKQGLECEWGIFQGCMVKMPSGNWIDYARLRYME